MKQVSMPDTRFRGPIKSLTRRPLLVCAALLGLHSPDRASASIIPVGCCADTACKGSYTLRIAINHAVSGDTVDLSALPLACSTITLTAGEIAIPQSSLTIAGPANRNVTVSGNDAGRVFYHSGGGVLSLTNFTVAHGHTSGGGGCIYSTGSLSLYNMQVRNGSAVFGGCTSSAGYTFLNHGTSLSSCSATASAGGVRSGGDTTLNASSVAGNVAGNSGGGIVAVGNVVLLNSSILDNSASQRSGALYAGGHVFLAFSTIRGNEAGSCAGVLFKGSYASLSYSTVESNTAVTGNGGGICAYTEVGGSPRTLTIANSTLSGNGAYLTGGGLEVNGYTGTTRQPTVLVVSDSTISGNTAGASGGGIHMFYGQATIHNSTIAFNSAPTGGGVYAGRFNDSGQAYRCSFEPDSSIFAKNTGSTIGSDLFFNNCPGVSPYAKDNLYQHSNLIIVGWINADPRLAPLAYHGGAVRTHALLATSPALDQGSNRDDLATDQRGAGFTRVAGAGADIGAYERQVDDDELFYDGFD